MKYQENSSYSTTVKTGRGLYYWLWFATMVGMLIFNPFYACIRLFIALAVWALNCGYMERTKARLQAEMQESIVKNKSCSNRQVTPTSSKFI